MNLLTRIERIEKALEERNPKVNPVRIINYEEVEAYYKNPAAFRQEGVKIYIINNVPRVLSKCEGLGAAAADL